MISLDTVRSWLEQHGYRDQYPRRDASQPEALLYVFVREGRRRLAVRSVRGKVKDVYFERIKQVVMQDEQDEGSK